jgi:serine/threonine-protein kinase RsbW
MNDNNKLNVLSREVEIITLSGKLTEKNVNKLELEIRNLLMSGKKFIILDCLELYQFEPTTYSNLSVLNNEVRKNKGMLFLTRINTELKKIFTQFDLSGSFLIEKSIGDVIEKYGGLHELETEQKIKYLNMEMVVTGTLDNLPKIRKFVESVLRNLNITDEQINLITVSVDEACTNIMRYAYKEDKEKHMIIQVKYEYPILSILVADNGDEFDPTEKELQVDVKEYIKQGYSGGLGIYIIETVMDKIKHYYIPNMGNRLILEKTIV